MRNRLRHMNSVKHWSKSNFIPAFVLAFVLAFLTLFLSACSTGPTAFSGSYGEAASSEEMTMPAATSAAAVNEHSEDAGSETGADLSGISEKELKEEADKKASKENKK